MVVVGCGFVSIAWYSLCCDLLQTFFVALVVVTNSPQNAAKRRKYCDLAISIYGTKYLGGLKYPTREINRGPKLGGYGPLSPLKTFFWFLPAAGDESLRGDQF